MLLFDELEDLFEWHPQAGDDRRARAQMSKQWFNETLEKNAIPTLWITNRVHGLDPAFLRRFHYVVEFEPLGPRERARVLSRHLGTRSALSSEEIASVAERYTASPGQLWAAVQAARLVNSGRKPTRAALEKVLAPVEKLLTGSEPSKQAHFEPKSYRLDALCCSTSPVEIAQRLSAWRPGEGPGLSMCLYGPPGTGKSEYARYLAWRMGRRVVYRRVSELHSMWVGQTEKNIAQAFREAESGDTFLLFDEVDSFLRERRGARVSWEVTEVNEFLQRLERFSGVVACTTNLFRELDAAALRRFIFKVEFRFLGPSQALAQFDCHFAGLMSGPISHADRGELEELLGRFRALAPGDFAAVARRERALGRTPSWRELVGYLEEEVRVKAEGPRTLGFGRSAS